MTPALFGAMLFAFSGFNLLHHHHVNMVAIVAHMPWLLGAADLAIVDERRRMRTLAFAAIALILGSEFLLGFPQAVWWNVMTLAAFGLFRASETGRWRRLLPCAAAVLIGTLLGGIQLAADGRRRGTLRANGLHAGLRADLLAASDQSAPAVVALRLRGGRLEQSAIPGGFTSSGSTPAPSCTVAPDLGMDCVVTHCRPVAD